MQQENFYEDFIRKKRFGALDGLRAFSVVAVIWHHVSGMNYIPQLNQGFRGVDLFFAISGFLITSLLIRERSRTGKISLKNFYIRRSLRIFPLYYSVLAMYCLLVALTLSGTTKGQAFWDNLPAFLTYTSNWFVDLTKGEEGVTFYFAWSLATEEQFYLLWPPLLILLITLFLRVTAGIYAAIALTLLQIAASFVGEQNLLLTILINLSPAIMMASAAAIIVHQPAAFRITYRLLGGRWTALPLAILLLAMIAADAPSLLIHTLMVLLVVTLCIREETILHPVLQLRLLTFIGAISYGMYLMHMLAANVVRRVLGHEVGIDIFIGATLLVTLAAYVSFRFFESPILRHANRFRHNPDPAPVPAAKTATIAVKGRRRRMRT